MKPFLKKVLLLVTILIFFLMIVEYLLSAIPNTYKYKREILENNLDSVELIILGTSHALGGLDPNNLTIKAINLANASQSLYYDIELLRYYNNNLKNLKFVIFEISFFTLWHTQELGFEPWRNKFYYKFWRIQPQSGERLRFYDGFYSNMYPLRKIKKIYQRSKNFNNIYLQNGFGKGDTAFNQMQIFDAKNRYSQLKKNYYHPDVLPLNLKLLENIIEFLQQKNITVIFIQYPYWKIFREQIEQNWIEKNNQILNNYHKKYGIKYYDFSNSNIFYDKYFSDVDHLNFRGAEILTQEVDSILRVDFECN